MRVILAPPSVDQPAPLETPRAPGHNKPEESQGAEGRQSSAINGFANYFCPKSRILSQGLFRPLANPYRQTESALIAFTYNHTTDFLQVGGLADGAADVQFSPSTNDFDQDAGDYPRLPVHDLTEG